MDSLTRWCIKRISGDKHLSQTGDFTNYPAYSTLSQRCVRTKEKTDKPLELYLTESWDGYLTAQHCLIIGGDVLWNF